MDTMQNMNHNPKPATKRIKEPSARTLEKWCESGVARATDGCRVEPDGVCPHGCKSWLLVLGLI